jgi:hypothetical protein
VLAPPLAALPPIFVNGIRRIGEASIMEKAEARFGNSEGRSKFCDGTITTILSGPSAKNSISAPGRSGPFAAPPRNDRYFAYNGRNRRIADLAGRSLELLNWTRRRRGGRLEGVPGVSGVQESQANENSVGQRLVKVSAVRLEPLNGRSSLLLDRSRQRIEAGPIRF